MSASPDLFAELSSPTQPWPPQPTPHMLEAMVFHARLQLARLLPVASKTTEFVFVVGYVAGKCTAVQDMVDLVPQVLTPGNIALIEDILNRV